MHAAVFLLATTAAWAASALEQRVDLLFRRPLGEQIALAPDGRHVAFTRQADNDLTIAIFDVGLGRTTTTVIADEARALEHSTEKVPARLRFLEWATARRLVFAPGIVFLPPLPLPGPGGTVVPGPPRMVSPVLAVDVDGKNGRQIVDSRDFEIIEDQFVPVHEGDAAMAPQVGRSRQVDVIGFAADDRQHLYVEVRGFTRTGNPPQVVLTELFRVDVDSGKTNMVNADNPLVPYVYDWQLRRRMSYVRAAFQSANEFLLRAPDGKGGWHPLEDRLQEWDRKAFRVTAENYFGDRAFPLGFDFDPNVMFVASNVGRDNYGVYAVDLTTGLRRLLPVPGIDFIEVETRVPSPALVFDRHAHKLAGVRSLGARPTTLWQDDELAGLQQAIEARFPGSTVEIRDWSADRDGFLVRISSAIDRGHYYVFLKREKRLAEVMPTAPWLTAAELHETHRFGFKSADGALLTGYLTTPKHPKIAIPPVVLCFAPGFPARAHPEFDPETQVLADMGFVVIRLNQRGTSGLGRAHRDAIAAGVDRVPVADAVATLDWLATRVKIDRKRVATFGYEFGGYLAVRALQLAPETFRCAVALNAPMDPNRWLPAVVTANVPAMARRALFERGAPQPLELSVLRHPETVTHPVLLVYEAGGGEVIEGSNQQLRSALASRGVVADTIEVNRDFFLELPQARAKAYAQMEEFFNVNLYNYDVKIGPTRVVK
jgi:dienelactone hydrolase